MLSIVNNPRYRINLECSKKNIRYFSFFFLLQGEMPLKQDRYYDQNGVFRHTTGEHMDNMGVIRCDCGFPTMACDNCHTRFCSDCIAECFDCDICSKSCCPDCLFLHVEIPDSYDPDDKLFECRTNQYCISCHASGRIPEKAFDYKKVDRHRERSASSKIQQDIYDGKIPYPTEESEEEEEEEKLQAVAVCYVCSKTFDDTEWHQCNNCLDMCCGGCLGLVENIQNHRFPTEKVTRAYCKRCVDSGTITECKTCAFPMDSCENCGHKYCSDCERGWFHCDKCDRDCCSACLVNKSAGNASDYRLNEYCLGCTSIETPAQ